MIDQTRRNLIGAVTFGWPATRLLAHNDKASSQLSDGNGSKVFRDVRQIEAGPLSIGYVEEGPPQGKPIVLIHGWPYDIHAFFDVVPTLVSAGFRVIIPHVRGFGSTRFRSVATLRNGQQAALAGDVVALMDSLGLPSAVIAGFDWGARSACAVAALWSDRCDALVSVSGYLISSQAVGQNPLPPAAEVAWWYQYYFATRRGAEGYAANTREFARLIWQMASPKWQFDDETFARSANALINPDHVAIVTHNYRWRIAEAAGEKIYDSLERKLATGPTISVPTITLEGDANSAPHPEPAAYARKFVGKYVHRTVGGGVGHNLPQEAPLAFARAIIDVTTL